MKTIISRAFITFQSQQPRQAKCCRYDQEGKPMSASRADHIYKNLGDLLNGWRLNEERTRLYRYFFLEDYMNAVKFVTEIALQDSRTTRNCPSFKVERGELMTLEAYSPSLNGLSMVDFEVAMNINQMKFSDYYLIEVKDLANYKSEVTAHKMRVQSKLIQEQLKSSQSG